MSETNPPDGYAVLLHDKNSAPGGFWFVGAYLRREVAEDVANGNGKSAEVRPFRFCDFSKSEVA